VPAFNEGPFVGDVVRTMPPFVDVIVVVDDCSTDDTAASALAPGDPRVRLVRHERNQGLGGSLITAHRTALEENADISVVMAGDGQMDPAYLPALLDPIIGDGYDFTKGNRFFSAASFRGMPRHRIFGNIVLTFLTKAATGYWGLIDPQNGYTAMARRVQERIEWDDVARDYSFENDVIARLGMLQARILDVDIPAIYGDEVSDIRLGRVVPDLLRTIRRAFWRRFWYQHVLRGFSPVGALGIGGALLTVWGVAVGTWVAVSSIGPAEASPATVMLAVVPLIVGVLLLLAAWIADIIMAPR
jgi:glycosyltransferase involved in cell wall biosynthesis